MPNDPLESEKERIDAFAAKMGLEFQAMAAYIAVTFVVAISWGVYFARVAFGIDLIGTHDVDRIKPEKSSPAILLIGAMGLTIFGVVYLVFRVRKLGILGKRGMTAFGAIENRNKWIVKGRRTPVTVVFSVNGIEFRVRKDINVEGNETRVRVLYDPKKPGRCIILP